MQHLAIECSSIGGSVAWLDGEQPVVDETLPQESGSVRSLAPAIEALIQQRGRPQFLSITAGPGSFTGLRVGLTTAKMLAMAWEIPVIPVDTLHVIAHQWRVRHPSDSAIVLPVVNAFRKQLFWAAFESSAQRDAGGLGRLLPTGIVDQSEWMAAPSSGTHVSSLTVSGPQRFVLTGPGLELGCPQIQEGTEVAEPDAWHPTATSVGTLGWQYFRNGKAVSWDAVVPQYVRRSAAEEKRLGQSN